MQLATTEAIVQGTVRDPAVLMYLDNDRNTKEAQQKPCPGDHGVVCLRRRTS